MSVSVPWGDRTPARCCVVLPLRSQCPLLPLRMSILVNLIEYAAFAEVFLLRLGPTAENVVDREQFHLCKRLLVFLRNLRIARTIGVACGNFLTFPGIPVSQVSLGHRAGAFLVGDRIDQGQWGLRKDRQ